MCQAYTYKTRMRKYWDRLRLKVAPLVLAGELAEAPRSITSGPRDPRAVGIRCIAKQRTWCSPPVYAFMLFACHTLDPLFYEKTTSTLMYEYS